MQNVNFYARKSAVFLGIFTYIYSMLYAKMFHGYDII